MDEYTGFEPFVRDSSKGQLITYAQLNELVVMSSPEDQPTKRLTFDKEYIPFPKLKRADFTQIAYPFGDDTLFRGNKATLEHVGMPLDNNLAVVLAGNQRDNPAVLANYKALYKLEINGNVNEVVADDEEASDYAYAISANFLPHVKSMTIADIDLSGIFLDLISRQTWFTQMQVLRLKMYPISVQEVLPMLNILPLLRVFESGVSELGHMLSHVPEELLPKYVQSMGPVHPNLKEWQIYQASNIDEALLDTCTNLLTIKCPHVKIVEVGASDDDYLIDI
ncbi:hypothetical protein LPJ74_004497 [Coemansia sp. RSA 1843]|nr:hypothetical protein LPJ74_004497 [Coemansia sp. RSA 1843]